MKSVLLAFGLLTLVSSSFAQGQQKGDASLRVEYQYIRTGAYDSSIGDIDIGNTDAHTILFSGDYAFTDKLKVFASLPYIRKRHKGAFPHDPTVDFVNYVPPDLRIADDGDYHGGFQDLYFGVSYRMYESPTWSITPFVSYGLPTRDYPFYAHAAIGRNVWHAPVGASVSFQPLFSDWFFKTDVAYVFTEKTLGIDTSHWLIYAAASFYLTPQFVPKVFVSIKRADGLAFPDDFPPESFDSEYWYYHDRTIKHNFINAGLGFDWFVNEKYLLSASAYTMVEPEQVNNIDIAFTIGLTAYFGGN